RRPLSRHGLQGARCTAAAILRCLLHRRLSDRAHRPERRRRHPSTFAARGTRLVPESGGRLQGRIALVTGASRGIGRAVATRFAMEGADLILIARTVGALEELDDEIRKINGKTSVLVPLDLREFDAIDRLGQALYDRFGRLDVLVGNAGD